MFIWTSGCLDSTQYSAGLTSKLLCLSQSRALIDLITLYLATLMRWLCFLLCFPCLAFARTSVLFVNPSVDNDPFFIQVEALARVAATQLDLDLTVINGDANRLLQKQKLTDYLQKNKPDYIIVQPYSGGGVQLMEFLADYPSKIITLERLWQPDEEPLVGRPGQKYPNWLAELYFDNVEASRSLTMALQQACPDADRLIGINGAYSHETDRRAEGVFQAMRQRGGVVEQIVNGKWERPTASEQVEQLIRRYPKARLIWTASDWMALGVLDTLEKYPEQRFCVGGFDWLPQSQHALQQGKLTASAGGHFAMAAWALVMIYDHAHGNLKLPVPDVPLLQLEILTDKNLPLYQPLLRAGQWQYVDFKAFSQPQKTNQELYQFSLHEALRHYHPKK